MEKKHPDAGRVFLMPGHEDCRHPVPAIVVNDDGSMNCGDMVPLKEGQPLLPGDLGHTGPAQVATKPYREGWDRTFDNSLN